MLEPGATGAVEISILARDFAHYEDGWQYENGQYRLLVGRHAENDFQELTVEVR